MTYFKRTISLMVVSILLLAGCCNCVNTVTVTNPTDEDRLPELVEISLQELGFEQGDSFVVKDHAGEEIPYQLTADGKVLFLVEIKAGQSAEYAFSKGTPAAAQTLACGREYADKHGVPQDVAWENDKVGFRLYSLQTAPIAAGYDLFAKRGTTLPVLEVFYAKNLDNTPAWDKFYELLESEGKEAALKYKRDSLSFHIDRGHGLDCYQVGPTLGAGVAALVNNHIDEGSQIIYQSGYESFEIIENGPLRFSTKFTFAPRAIGKDSSVVETRIVTLDAGSQLNHTTVHYKLVALDANGAEVSSDLPSCEILTGIVLREKGGENFQRENYISYASPTQVLLDEWVEMRNGDENGTLYVGHVFPTKVRTDILESHVVAVSEYDTEAGFEYYWGFGWDKSGFENHEQWNTYLEKFAQQVKSPLIVK